MTEITYLTGDATTPKSNHNNIIICHINNDIGAWGSGFVLAVSEKWPKAKKEYLSWYKVGYEKSNQANKFELGNIQLVKATDRITICNMIAQKGIKTEKNKTPIRYEALYKCLDNLAIVAFDLNVEVHMPKIGSERAGGDWDKIEEMIKTTLCFYNVKTFVYNFKK